MYVALMLKQSPSLLVSPTAAITEQLWNFFPFTWAVLLTFKYLHLDKSVF